MAVRVLEYQSGAQPLLHGEPMTCRLEICASGCLRVVSGMGVSASAKAAASAVPAIFPWPVCLTGGAITESSGRGKPLLLVATGGSVTRPEP